LRSSAQVEAMNRAGGGGLRAASSARGGPGRAPSKTSAAVYCDQKNGIDSHASRTCVLQSECSLLAVSWVRLHVQPAGGVVRRRSFGAPRPGLGRGGGRRR